MKVELSKDWAGNKKGQEIEILDQSVLDKGFELGLFKTKEKVTEKEK